MSTLVESAEPAAKPVVLVVDDDVLVRMYAVELFEDLGYEALEAEDGLDALQVMEARRDVSLLFSDCRMPRMTGPELAAVTARRWPDVRVVLVSGYTQSHPGDWPLLNKPFSAPELARIVEEGPPA